MIKNTLDQLEARIGQAKLDGPARTELLKVVMDLRKEVESLDSTHAEDAATVASFSTALATEATRREPDTNLVSLAVKSVKASVSRFETSHPTLTSVVNQFCTILAGMGI